MKYALLPITAACLLSTLTFANTLTCTKGGYSEIRDASGQHSATITYSTTDHSVSINGNKALLDKNNQAHLATTYQFAPNANNHDANLHGTTTHAVLTFQKGYTKHVPSHTVKFTVAPGKTQTFTSKAHTLTIPTTVNIAIHNIGTDSHQYISDTYTCNSQ
jgi:hypothetical protein